MSEWSAGSKLPAALGITAWLVAEVAAANVFVEAGMSDGPVLERQGDGSWLVIGLIQQSTRASNDV